MSNWQQVSIDSGNGSQMHKPEPFEKSKDDNRINSNWYMNLKFNLQENQSFFMVFTFYLLKFSIEGIKQIKMYK